jgi:hypothetical protein
MTTETKKTESSTVNTTSNLSNLTGFVGKAVTFAEASTLVILIELATMLKSFEITAENFEEVTTDKRWSKRLKAYNRSRMEAFAKKLLTKAMQARIAFLDWATDKEGNSFTLFGNVIRLTDTSKKGKTQYTARLSNGYNSAKSVVWSWMESDPEACIKALAVWDDAETPDVKAYNAFRRDYQAERRAEKLAEIAESSESENSQANGKPEEAEMIENASSQYMEVWNKCESIKRFAGVCDSEISDTEVYTELFTHLDNALTLLKQIASALPQDDEQEAEAEAEAVNS